MHLLARSLRLSSNLESFALAVSKGRPSVHRLGRVTGRRERDSDSLSRSKSPREAGSWFPVPRAGGG